MVFPQIICQIVPMAPDFLPINFLSVTKKPMLPASPKPMKWHACVVPVQAYMG